jgi:hypothetical protein
MIRGLMEYTFRDPSSHPESVMTWIDRLPVASGACFDSYEDDYATTCLSGTRTALLQQVSEWVRDPHAKPIFWLNGMAGTGKSTISRTVARSFANEGLLAASFFFKRGESDRGSLRKLFTTLASEIVIRRPAVRPHIRKALEKDPGIVRKAVREQFETLIYEPLAQIDSSSATEQAFTLVIDALDECDRDEDMKLVIGLFGRLKAIQSLRFKVFITSRPEVHVRLGFKAIEGTYQDLILHEIKDEIIYQDIFVFWEYHLHHIRQTYNSRFTEAEEQIPSHWPEQSDIHTLTKMAVPLFIFAATACRLISDWRFGDPDKMLEELLDRRRGGEGSDLTETYLPVLRIMVKGLSPSDRQSFMEGFQKIIGTIIILAEPLSRHAISQLLEVPQRSVSRILDRMHSVLSVPESSRSPVRLLHLSFRDFLVETSETRNKHMFSISEESTHEALARQCVSIMKKHLKQNILDHSLPEIPRSEINSLAIDDALPPELKYACLYWVHHLQESQTTLADGDLWSEFLMCHLLHWIEVLSLMGRAWELTAVIKNLRSRIPVS